MSKEDSIKLEGTVVELLPNNMFRVQIPGENFITAYLNGKMRQNKIRVGFGDKVEVEVTPYDLTRGRITFRHR